MRYQQTNRPTDRPTDHTVAYRVAFMRLKRVSKSAGRTFQSPRDPDEYVFGSGLCDGGFPCKCPIEAGTYDFAGSKTMPQNQFGILGTGNCYYKVGRSHRMFISRPKDPFYLKLNCGVAFTFIDTNHRLKWTSSLEYI